MVLPWVPEIAIVRLRRGELAQQLGPVEHRAAPRRGRHELGVVFGDRRRDHHLGARGQVGGVVADGGSIPAARRRSV